MAEQISPQERAKYYRDLAAGARRNAANSKNELQQAYLALVVQWETLAAFAESQANSVEQSSEPAISAQLSPSPIRQSIRGTDKKAV